MTQISEESADLPELLFHYTDAKGLLGILQHRVLWATDIFCLNDSTEVAHLFDQLKDAFAEVATGDAILVSDSLAHFGDLAMNIARQLHAFYVTCFSETRDLLSQWRGYANGIGGFALGFDRHGLAMDDGSLLPEKVSYDASGQRDFYRYTVADVVQHYDPADEGWWATAMSEFFRGILQDAPHYKDPAFREEREWRIVARHAQSSISSVKFRSSSTISVIPYVELDITDRDGVLPLKEIMIGPCPDPDLAERNLRILLEASGFTGGAVVISRSKVPLRA